LACQLAAALGEAVLDHRAAAADALGAGDGDLAPGTVGDGVLEGVAVAAVRLLRPLAQPPHLLAQPFPAAAGGIRRGLGEQGTGFDIDRIAAGDLVLAQVVRPALQQREGGGARQMRGQGLDEPREVLPDARARAGGPAGTGEGRDWPVPGPAWASRWRPPDMARSTASAIDCCPARGAPPMAATAASIRVASGTSAAVGEAGWLGAAVIRSGYPGRGRPP